MKLSNLDPFLENLILINSRYNFVLNNARYFTEYWKQLKRYNSITTYFFTNKYLNYTTQQLKYLVKLNLQNLNLISVPNLELPNLAVLILNRNELEFVPNFRLPKLVNLGLYDNKLKIVPDFKFLPKLESLNLQNNNLVSVPKFQTFKLEKLYLNDNPLRKIPDFSYLPELYKIRLKFSWYTPYTEQQLKEIYDHKLELY